LDIIDKRVSAKLAEPCYENITPPEELNKFKSWFLNSQSVEFREKGSGRPTKKERRVIDDYKVEIVSEDSKVESTDNEEWFNFE
jgi:ribosome-associated heat shock protein Hsp15